MTDVWKIGQDVKANDFYNNSKNGYVYDTKGEGENAEVKTSYIWFMQGDIMAAKALSTTCNAMAKTYEQIIADQNDYMTDIDATLDEISELEDYLKDNIKKLEAEISELLKKREDGTITEEEEAELIAKTGELNNLQSQTNSQITEKNDNITETAKKASESECRSKAVIAEDYSETALEKGKPLSETKDKRKSFWRKLTGSWDKSAEREAGKKLMEAGEYLQNQVNTSKDIDTQISKKSKKSV